MLLSKIISSTTGDYESSFFSYPYAIFIKTSCYLFIGKTEKSCKPKSKNYINLRIKLQRINIHDQCLYRSESGLDSKFISKSSHITNHHLKRLVLRQSQSKQFSKSFFYFSFPKLQRKRIRRMLPV